MAPRKPGPDEQQEDFRQTLEAFQIGLREALQTAMENALTTVLERQQNQFDARADLQQLNRPRQEETDDDDLVENVFADHDRDRPVHNIQQQQHLDNNRPHRPIGERENTSRWDSGFRQEIPEFLETLNPEDFIDWTHMVEEILEFKQVTPEM